MTKLSYEELLLENQKLREQNHRLSRMMEAVESNFNNTLECIAVLDKNFNFIRVNNNYAKANYKTPCFFVGKNHFELFPSEEGEHMFKSVIQTKKPLSISSRPFYHPERPGEVQYWDWKLVPLLNHQYEVDFLFLFLMDVTETKLLRDEMVRMDRLNLLGQAASGIAHEIRNPMTTVKGFLQLLKERNESEQLKGYWQIMIEELDRANSIITEFLSLAQNKSLNITEKCLNQSLDSLYPLLQSDAIHADKMIVLEKGAIPSIPFDEHEIRQLILNLVRNGLEAMAPGGTLRIRTFQDEDQVILEIQDEGTGISLDILDKIWMPFFTTKGQGTGLGLSVCYRIAQRHDAEIDIKSCSEGTSFYVKFKIKKKADECQ